MGHIVSNLPWCVIDIDTTAGRVFLQERWLYHWVHDPKVNAWTEAEKTAFHNRADTQIWAICSNRVRLEARGTSTLARRFRGRGIPINLDIRRVTAAPHWNVTVTKIPPADFKVSSVIWVTRQINLDSNDFGAVQRCRGAPKRCFNQVPVAHEFGHAAGNTATLGRGDEYKAGHSHANDFASIMNIGSRLRDRHFRTIVDEMNKMVPDTTFQVKTIS